MGGTESQVGVDTVYYGDSGVQKVASTAYSTSGASQIIADTTDPNHEAWHVGATTAFADGSYYTEETWTGWNDQPETERKFFDGSGNQLGSSYSNVDTWNNGSEDVTNTNTSYNDASGNWIGWEWSNNLGESGSNFEKTKSDSDSGWAGLWGEFGGLQNSSNDVIRFSDTSVIVQSGSNTFTMDDGTTTTTVTEEYKHLFEVDSSGYAGAHLGGKEVRDGETIQWNADWQQGAVTFSINTSSDIPIADTTKAYELFSDSGAAVYCVKAGYRDRTTYYSAL